MNSPHPAVQSLLGVSPYRDSASRKDKRLANRRYRRVLNAKTRGFVLDPDSFDGEDFAAPTFSDWDIW